MAGILENALLLGLGSLSLAKKETEALLRDALKRHNIPDTECESIVKAVTDEGAKAKQELEAEIEKIRQSRGASLMPGYAELADRVTALEAKVAALEAKSAKAASEKTK